MYKKLTLSLLGSSLLITACFGDGVNATDSAMNLNNQTDITTMSGNSLPDYAFKTPTLSDDSDDDVHALIKQAALAVQDEPRQARKNFVKALSLVKSGKAISEYDYLWTRYGLLKSSYERGTGNFGPGTREDYMRLAAQTLDYLDEATATGIWEFTELGAFQKENYRIAGNGLAWSQMELATNNQELETALDNIEYAVRYLENPEHYYIFDTKVRILLKLKREQEAFEIVKNILDEMPSFGDFQDFNDNQAYQQWLKAQ